ncbi:MAG: universal stress protein [Ottowia sp.]|nr:universal stress protein [Ottowia sp.]
MKEWNSPVVVGYDTSRESEFALKWAAEVAQRRAVSLIVVHATSVEHPAVEMARAGILEMYQQRAQEIAEQGAAQARTLASIQVTAAGVQSGAAAALVDYSRRASLVVVGHRGRSLLSGALLGSDAAAVATHAACPVAVIRQSPRPLPSMQHPVVVGVDGSEHSTRALDEAALLAEDTGSFLRVVVAWRPPEKHLWSGLFAQRQAPPAGAHADKAAPVALPGAEAFPQAWRSADEQAGLYDQLASDVAERAAETARWATERVHARHPDLKVEQVVSEGRAAQAIVAAAADASMIAVGARGHGDLKTLLLGSVSRKVMQRAECAVYVIR